MQRPIQAPFLERRNMNAQSQKLGYSSGTNTFPGNSLVYLTGAGILAAIATAGTACYGWSHGPSVTPGTPPPAALYQNVYPFDLSDGALIVMNITNTAGDSANSGDAATAPTLNEVVIGQSYGILNPTTGANAGIQQLNISDTTNALLTVVGLYPNQALTDQNGLVLVRINPACFQA